MSNANHEGFYTPSELSLLAYRLRKERGMRQSDVADLINSNRIQVQRGESGNSPITAALIVAALTNCKAKEGYYIGGSDD